MDRGLIKKIITISLAVMLFSTIFSGCSGKTESYEKDNGIITEETTKKETEATTESVKKLAVGMEIGFPPYETYKKDGKTPEGFDIDLMEEIGDRLGYKIEYVDVAFDAIFNGIDKNYDVVCSAVTITLERQKTMLFSNPYHTIKKDEKLGIAMGKNNHKLQSDINRALSDMKNDGTLKRLEKKWFKK